MFPELVKGLIHLMRPAEWTKSFGNMAIAIVFATYLYGIAFDLGLFALGAVAVAFMWSGLYTLNDLTDWKVDKLHEFKKHRPIPMGWVPPASALIFSFTLVIVSLIIGLFIGRNLTNNYLFFFCLVIMLFNQLLYTTKPFNFKKRAPFDLISGSLVNPLFRFYAGWTLFIPSFNAPLLAILFVLGLQFGGYGLYRLSSKDHDEKLGYKSSAVVLGKKRLRYVFYPALVLGCLGFLFAIVNGVFFPALNFLGWLPLKYALLPLITLLFVPFYIPAIKHPEKAHIKKMYRLMYFHYTLFIVILVALYFLPF